MAMSYLTEWFDPRQDGVNISYCTFHFRKLDDRYQCVLNRLSHLTSNVFLQLNQHTCWGWEGKELVFFVVSSYAAVPLNRCYIQGGTSVERMTIIQKESES